MHLISASRRTDVPAFYSEWFLGRLAAGFCEWVNPFNAQTYRVSLRPEDVLGMVCWTRNPAPLLGSLEALGGRGYNLSFHVTINGYPRQLESHTPSLEGAVRTFHNLAGRLAPDRAWWRYDPILLTEATPAGWHLGNFAALAKQLEGATRRCYFSFASIYRKTRRNLNAAGLAWREPSAEEKLDLTGRLSGIAKGHGIEMFACCDDSLQAAGVRKAHCVEAAGVEAAPTRPGCGCSRSVDIGAYDTCPFGCVYCYATGSRQAALARRAEHDPADTALWRPAGQTACPTVTAGPPAAAPAREASAEPAA